MRGTRACDTLWTWPWAGGCSSSQNKAQVCQAPEGLSHSGGRLLCHTWVAATSCSFSSSPRTRDERPRTPSGCVTLGMARDL